MTNLERSTVEFILALGKQLTECWSSLHSLYHGAKRTTHPSGRISTLISDTRAPYNLLENRRQKPPLCLSTKTIEFGVLSYKPKLHYYCLSIVAGGPFPKFRQGPRVSRKKPSLPRKYITTIDLRFSSAFLCIKKEIKSFLFYRIPSTIGVSGRLSVVLIVH